MLAAVLLLSTVPVSSAFEHFYNLEFDDAILEFRAAAAREPADPSHHNHVALGILYRDLFRSGALESELVTGGNPFLRRPKLNLSPDDRREFEEAIRRAMALSRERMDRNPRDTMALYTLGVAYGLRANYNFLVRKAWRDALKDATAGRKLHNRVTEMDPSFLDARLMQGMHEYVVGSLPWGWRFLGFLVGYRGNKEEGIRMLEQVARQGKLNRVDAEVLLCAVYRRERRPAQAAPLLKDLIRRFPRNFLFHLELSQMYSDLGDKQNALAVLDRLMALKRSGTPGYDRLPPARILYAKGVVQFWYFDLDEALENLKIAARGAEDLDLNTGAMAWLRLGQVYDLKGQRNLALAAYRRAGAFAPESDAARESRRYLDVPYRRKRG
jgi:tetratricopeptide (TPR) repeat protein